jgi:DNA replication licensing factor MCM3
MASSRPASQLLRDESQSQSQNNGEADADQDDDDDDEDDEDSEQQPSLTPARFQAFQSALGQLIDGPLFANDAADFAPLVAAVNAKLRSGEVQFGDREAERALEMLNERNRIMFSGGIVYKI